MWEDDDDTLERISYERDIENDSYIDSYEDKEDFESWEEWSDTTGGHFV